LKLGKKVEDSEKRLFLYQRREFLRLEQRIAKAVKERRANPSICKGPQAEHQVRAKLERECGVLTVKGPENSVDILALKVKKDGVEFPLRAVGVEVENFPEASHSIKITKSKLMGKSGPFFVIFVETNTAEYSYLVYTYHEMEQFLQDIELRDGSYQFSVPRKSLKKDERYKRYYEKWEKITKAVYG